MNVQIPRKRYIFLNRVLSALIAFIFSFTTILSPRNVQAQVFLDLPVPGSMVIPTAGFTPPLIKGLTIYPNNPLEFNFIVDSGQSGIKIQAPEFRTESRKLIKYFLAALTIPDEDMWVNLSPYEKDRVISAGFGQTEMGRDLLAQDYLLKQLMASLTYPEDELGRNFWDKVYTKARRLYGTQDIPVNTFNKIWIVPDKAVVYEIGSTAYVVKTHLKVMLEADYLALKENMNNIKLGLDKLKADEAKQLSDVSSAIVKEILIPEIEKEVNEGKTFANLRQIYNSMVLATWYKKNLKESLLGQVYVNQNKIKGVDLEDKTAKEKIYQQYLEAFKKGVYNYIKEDTDPATQKSIPRKYFSGGWENNPALIEDKDDVRVEDFAQLSDEQESLFVSALDEPLAQASQNDHAARVEVNLVESPEDSKKIDELKVAIQEGEQRKEEEIQQEASASQDKTATQETTDTTADSAALTPDEADRQITNLLAQTARLAQNLLDDSKLLDTINAVDLQGIEQKLAEAERSLGRDSQRAQAAKGILQVIMALKSKNPGQIKNALQDVKRNIALSSGTIQMLGELVGGPQINNALNQIIEILRGETNALLAMDANNILDLSQAIDDGETTLGRENQRAAMGRILLDLIGSFRASPWNKEVWGQIMNKFGEMESISSSRMFTRFRALIADHAIARVGDEIFKILNEIGRDIGSVSNETIAPKIEELRKLLTSIKEFMQRDSQRIALYQNLLNIIEGLHLGNWTQTESAFSAIITSGLMDARGLASLKELIAEVRITKAYGEMQEIMEAVQQNEEVLLEISKERIRRIRNDLLNAQEFRGRPSGRVAIAQPVLDELERAAGAQEDQLSQTSPEELQNWQDQLDDAMRKGDMDRVNELLGGDLDQGQVGDDQAALTDINFPEENRHDFESWGEDTYNLLWNTVEGAPQEWVIKLQSKNISSFRLEGVQDVNQLQIRIQINASFIGNRWLAIGGPFHIYILEDKKEIIVMDRLAYAHHEFLPNTRAWIEELDQAVRKNNVDEITRLLGAEEDLGSTDQAFLIDSSATDDTATLKATVEVGGIDLNPKLLDLQIKRDGNGVPLPLLQQPIGTMNIQGFLPIIVDVIPFSPIFTGKVPLGLSLIDRNSPIDSAKGRPVENFRYIDPSLFSQNRRNFELTSRVFVG